MKLKCHMILAVIFDLPPPGGPIAAMKIIASICLKDFSFDFLSYQPP